MNEERLRADIRAFLADARARGDYEPRCHAWMTAHSPAFSAALGERGWIGMTWPRQYGGAERSARERLVVIEELVAAGAPVAAHWFAERQVGPALLRNGTAEQQARYLPSIASGRTYFAIGMSEPEAGSDLAAIRTRARRSAYGWVVSGTKVWTSHADKAQHLLALVRTDERDADDPHAGISQLVIDLHAPGVTVRPIRTLDGGSHFAEVVLNDVEVGPAALLGTEGLGWAQAVAELAYERSGPERYLSNLPLLAALIRGADGPSPEVGELVAELQTLRALSVEVAETLEMGDAPVVAAALVKDLGSRFERKVVDVARRLRAPLALGSAAQRPERADDYERLLHEAVVHDPDSALRGGAVEILRGVIARELVQS